MIGIQNCPYSGSGLGIGLELALGLSGGSGNSYQKLRNYQHNNIWVVIPKVGNSDI